MKTIRFTVDEVYVNSPVVLRQDTIDLTASQGIVHGANSNSGIDIPIGTIFTKITKVIFTKDIETNNYLKEEFGAIASVELLLEEVYFYGHTVDILGGGHSGGLKLNGTGLEKISKILKNKKSGEYFHLEI